jgi:hypothetical protein
VKGQPPDMDAWPSGFREHRPPGTVFPARDSDYSAELHDQVVVEAWEGTPIGVDVDMAPLLTGLWRLGYRTLFSCQGDDAPAGDVWAYIVFPEPEMARQFTADFGLTEYLAEAGPGDAVVRFPPADVRALRDELLRRGVITRWEDIRAAALRKASELEAMFAGPAVVTEAELAARGIFPVTVAHGTPEAPDDEALLRSLAAIAGECGPLEGLRGGNEHTTYLFSGPAASASAAAFTARVTGAAPAWWRVTPTSCPSWHPDAG